MAGHYVDLSTPWYETRILNCSFCGKMIAARYWHDDAFVDDKFCEPSCADVKRRLKNVASPNRQQSPHERHP
jgi:hypothetical protein